ncbi:MAG: TonB-dependent receptor [Acidobacteriota bacterium]|nr:MAG: TonB-dependent receptor [Acidobacteriota bacterium]
MIRDARYLVAACALLGTVAAASGAQEAPQDKTQDPAFREEVVVTGEEERFRLRLDELALGALADSAEFLKRVPGANVNRNGPLAGIAQYRGLFGDRLNVVVDGVPMAPVCPNHMDPPLGYIPLLQLESIEVHRGIAPVSSGLETLGGTIIARSRSLDFGAGEEWEFRGTLAAFYGSVNDGRSAGLAASLANARHLFHATGAGEEGGDADFPGGTVVPSRYKRTHYGAGYGFKLEDHRLNFAFRRDQVGKTGSPSLPMDTLFHDVSILNAEYDGVWSGKKLEAALYHSTGEHEMDNFSLRPPMDPAKKRISAADNRLVGYRLSVGLASWRGWLELGADGNRTRHDAVIRDPDNAMFLVVNFRDSTRERYGLYGEWRTLTERKWGVQAGLRYNLVRTHSGPVSTSMGMAQVLADGFNGADRSRTDHNVDWVFSLWRFVTKRLVWSAEAARKTRSPSHQERYLWLPLQSTGGLADGNTYVGDVELDPEVSHEANVGLEWGGKRAYVHPHVFYRRVDDYIQGTPASDASVVMVSTMMGDPTPLRFRNVEAELYGVDADWNVALYGNWSVGGVVSYVRGERRDVDDDLYRIAPLNGSAAVRWEKGKWLAMAEGEFYARQCKVSATNGEVETSGYGLLNLRGRFRVSDVMTLTAGVENVADKKHYDHLGGYNRVKGGDVGLGKRLPRPERRAFATLNVWW